MSEFTTRKITDRAGTGAPSFTYGLNSGGSDSGLIGKAYTASGTEPSSPANGDTWYDSTNDKFYLYVNGEFKQITHANAVTLPWGGSRGFRHGALTAPSGNTIEYWDIGTAGNAVDFGDLTASKNYRSCAVSNGARAVIALGHSNINNGGGSEQIVANMEYITCATAGNAQTFGNLTLARYEAASVSNGTRGCFGGGVPGFDTNVIDYITIASTGNATDFGDMAAYTLEGSVYTSVSKHAGMGGSTRGVFAGGKGDYYNFSPQISYITIATTGNGVDFGDLTDGRRYACGASDLTRGLIFAGSINNTNSAGNRYTNIIDYITIDTSGNAIDFGDLTEQVYHAAACADKTYATRFGGISTGGMVNTIDRVTVQTTGNASDHGDLSSVSAYGGGVSGNAS